MRTVVIGGGVFGASTAYHLARAGADVTLIDRNDQGRATAAGAGIVSPWGTRIEDPAIYALLAGGARYYPALTAMLAEDGEHDIGYRQVGALFTPDDPAELDAVERRVRQRAGNAPEAGRIERLDAQQARTLFPPLRPNLAGLHISGGARVNGRLVAAALRRASSARGARVIDASATLLLGPGGVRGVTLGDGEVIEADAVIVAAGAWATELLAPAAIHLAVAPQRGQIVHFRQPGTDTSHWPTLQPMTSYYMLAFDDARVVVGASREFGAGFDYRLTAAGVAGVLEAALHSAPGLADWTIEEIRIGFRPLADDNRPMLGAAAGVDRLFIGNGLGASGLTMGPYAGALLANAVLGKEEDLPLAAFDPLRNGALQNRPLPP